MKVWKLFMEKFKYSKSSSRNFSRNAKNVIDALKS